MIKLRKEHTFDYAHRLRYHGGACRNIHGHTGRVILTVGVSDDTRERSGVTIDFKHLSRFMRERIDAYFDHAMLVAHGDDKVLKLLKGDAFKLYELPGGEEPTAEWMATEILEWFIDFADVVLGRGDDLGMVGVEFFEGVGSSAYIEVERTEIKNFLDRRFE